MVQMFSIFEPVNYVASRRALLRQMDEIFDVIATAVDEKVSVSTHTPRFAFRETDDMFVLNLDIPGVQREDLNIELIGNQLQISGQRKYEDSYGKRTSSFRQGFNLPEGVQTEHIAADLKDGVLELAIQKPAAVKPTKIKIGDGAAKGFLKNLLGTDKKSKDAVDVKNASPEAVEVRAAGEPSAALKTGRFL